MGQRTWVLVWCITPPIWMMLCWNQSTGTSPPVLVATYLFGPDVMIRCHSSPSNSAVGSSTTSKVFLMGQLKSYTEGRKQSLNTKTTKDAITSLDPTHWFKKEVSHLCYCSWPIKNFMAVTKSTSKTHRCHRRASRPPLRKWLPTTA